MQNPRQSTSWIILKIFDNSREISLLDLDLEAFSFHFHFSISISSHFHFTFISRSRSQVFFFTLHFLEKWKIFFFCFSLLDCPKPTLSQDTGLNLLWSYFCFYMWVFTRVGDSSARAFLRDGDWRRVHPDPLESCHLVQSQFHPLTRKRGVLVLIIEIRTRPTFFIKSCTSTQKYLPFISRRTLMHHLDSALVPVVLVSSNHFYWNTFVQNYSLCKGKPRTGYWGCSLQSSRKDKWHPHEVWWNNLTPYTILFWQPWPPCVLH